MAESALSLIRSAYMEALTLDTDDLMVVDYIISLYTANKHPKLTEPVWGYIIGPPSTSKTECLRPYMGHKDYIFISNMTENALLSGYEDAEGNDPSLIKLLDGKLLIWKDMTAMLQDNPTKVSKICGDLRDAYDGHCAKPSGRSGLRSYVSKFGVIAAVTDYIDAYNESNQQLGERFVSFRTCRVTKSFNDQVDFLMSISTKFATKTLWRAQLAGKVQAQLLTIKQTFLTDPLPTIDTDTDRQLARIALLLSTLRTSPIKGSPVEAESGARLMQQLTSLGLGRIIADNRKSWTGSDTSFVLRVVIDTLSPIRRRLLMALYQKPQSNISYTINQLATLIRTPPASLAAIISQFMHTAILVESRRNTTNNNTYALSANIRTVLNETGLFIPGPHLPNPRPLSTPAAMQE